MLRLGAGEDEGDGEYEGDGGDEEVNSKLYLTCSLFPVKSSLFPVLRQMTIQTVNFNCSQPLN
ncbi:hypothetical protein [Coleofasciculus sp.]|uniref:hypothetical protein n=1 Tax=Coleofasciculus sp. TaxID=3100458 RepID=UPI003A45BAFF